MKNIHDQQCQMADFVRRYYRGQTVGAHDIGALCFHGQAEVVDLAGLGDRRMFWAVASNDFTTKVLQDYCASRGVVMAMVYDPVFKDAYALPDSWKRVGTLQIQDNYVCAMDTVSFYAVAHDAAPQLAEYLREFAKNVPTDVHVQVK